MFLILGILGRMGGWNVPNIALSPSPSNFDLDSSGKQDDKKKKSSCLFWSIIIYTIAMLAITAIVFFV